MKTFGIILFVLGLLGGGQNAFAQSAVAACLCNYDIKIYVKGYPNGACFASADGTTAMTPPQQCMVSTGLDGTSQIKITQQGDRTWKDPTTPAGGNAGNANNTGGSPNSNCTADGCPNIDPPAPVAGNPPATGGNPQAAGNTAAASGNPPATGNPSSSTLTTKYDPTTGKPIETTYTTQYGTGNGGSNGNGGGGNGTGGSGGQDNSKKLPMADVPQVTADDYTSVADQNKQIKADTKTLNATPKYDADGNVTQAYTDQKQIVDDEKAQRDTDQQTVKNIKNGKDADGKTVQTAGSAAAGMDEKTENKACGQYGGKSCENTNLINTSINLGNQMADKIGTAVMGSQGTTAATDLANKGISATNQDFIDSQKKLALENAKANNRVGLINSAGALFQGFRAGQHVKSASDVKFSQADLLREVDIQTKKDQAALKTCDPQVTNCQSIKDDLAYQQSRKKNTLENGTREARLQSDEAVVATAAALTTAGQAAMHYSNAARFKKEADSMPNAAGSGGGAAWNFNPPQMQNQDPGLVVTAPTPDTGAITNTDPGSGQLGGGLKDFNPNLGANGAVGPPAGGFKADDTKPGTAGDTGLGSAGGTSASHDSGAGDAKGDAPGKPQTGGQYASGDGGSPKFSRGSSGGSGAGVGLDFGDLLKKLLPGDDDKKDNRSASLDLDSADRSPASDQAAVIGRTKNIFQEISKRYQKKNSEGAVIIQ